MLRPFELVEPTSLSETFGCLEHHGEEAKVYAGGSELLVAMRLGLLHSKMLVNIKHVPGMDQLELENGSLRVGSLVTHRRVETSALVRERFPLIARMESKVANVRVRNVGTLGGNLAFAEPHSDPATLFLVYGAEVVLQSSRGQRRIPLSEFFVGPYETVMEPAEILVEIRIPSFPQGMKGAYIRWGVLERPALNVAVGARLAEDRLLEAVRVAVGCVGPIPIRLQQLEESLRGMELSAAYQHIGSSGTAVRQWLAPVSDIFGSDDYKVYMVKTLLQRALRQAVEGDDHG
ncbi:MAG: xanthine dehydrogenase family protein subunit M [Deltaproteobacteria bacterium]|nr:xanthine dehydrogenase family protein subunit M [Deltaproteobacteria bacterium]